MKYSKFGLVVLLAFVVGIALGSFLNPTKTVEIEVPVEVLREVEVVNEVETIVEVPVIVEVVEHVEVPVVVSFDYQNHDYGIVAKHVDLFIGGYQVYDFESTMMGITCDLDRNILVAENSQYVWYDTIPGCSEYPEEVDYVYIMIDRVLYPVDKALGYGVITTDDLDEAGYLMTFSSYYHDDEE